MLLIVSFGFFVFIVTKSSSCIDAGLININKIINYLHQESHMPSLPFMWMKESALLCCTRLILHSAAANCMKTWRTLKFPSLLTKTLWKHLLLPLLYCHYQPDDSLVFNSHRDTSDNTSECFAEPQPLLWGHRNSYSVILIGNQLHRSTHIVQKKIALIKDSSCGNAREFKTQYLSYSSLIYLYDTFSKKYI